MIILRNLYKQYDKKPVIRDLNAQIGGGRIYGLLGTNGAGKTTLLKMLAGLLPPTSGEIFICGEKLDFRHNTLYDKVGFVPDHVNLYDYLTGEEYLRFAAEMFGMKNDEVREFIDEKMEQTGLKAAGSNLIKTYSHGMKQTLSILAAIMHRPRVLILDEPLTGIDLINGRVIRQLLAGYAERGNLVIFSTHMLELAHALCHEIGVLHEGRIDRTVDPRRHTLPELAEIIEDAYVRRTS
jgi:ABC-2 type transport system ATP-binding protein